MDRWAAPLAQPVPALRTPLAVVKSQRPVGRGQGWYPPLGSANSAWRSPTRPARRHQRQRAMSLDRWPVNIRRSPSATLHWMGGLGEPYVSLAKRCRRCGTTKPREAFSPDRVIATVCTHGVGHVSPRRSAAGAPRTARATTPPAGSTPIRHALRSLWTRVHADFVGTSGTAGAGVASTGT
jgi:hypothetical protein